MKELKEQPEVRPLVEPNYRGLLSKNYIRAKKCKSTVIAMRVEAVEMMYHRLLKSIKELYKADMTRVTVFERDYKRDRGSLDSMHSFITPDLYFELRCDHDLLCWIDYDINESVHKEAIISILNLGNTVTYFKKKQLQRDFNVFYKNVLAYQENKFKYVL